MHVQYNYFLYSLLMNTVLLNQASSAHIIPYVTKPQEGCATRCGDVEIKYPFGIGGNCSCNGYFNVTCDTTSSLHKPKPILTQLNLELLKVHSTFYNNDSRLMFGEVTINTPTVKACTNSTSEEQGAVARWNSVDLRESPFFYDANKNVFGSVGCYGKASLYSERGEVLGSINRTSSCSNSSYKHNCNCQKDINNFGNLIYHGYSVEVSVNKTGNCQAAFMVGKTSADLASNDTATVTFTTVVGSHLPVVLGWSQPDFCYPEGYGAAFRFGQFLGVMMILVAPTIILSCCCWSCWMYKTRKRRKEVRLRAKYFSKRLAESSSSDREVIEKTKLFTIKELKKATDKFNEDRILGRGGQGIVYKGMLRKGQIIAIKRSKCTFEESQWKEFINEVILLSQVNHRNIVRILGCCLESKVPLLVYEFIPNGTLSQHIHNNPTNEFLLSWEMRVRIACEVASAIAYLHSSSTTPIYHRDIKSTNILLDEKFTAKVSDFGISKAISINQTHLTTKVQGTFGYLDPEYFQSSQFSEKSDVYSFGVILVEILTGLQPILVTSCEENKSLVDYFISSMIESGLEEILDPIVLAENKIEEVMFVANLAKRCLNSSGTRRPTMVQVAMELERLRKKSCSMPLTIGHVSLEIKNAVGRSKLEMGNAYTSPTMCTVAGVHEDDDEEKSLFYGTT